MPYSLPKIAFIMHKNILLIGATGRLGRICKKALSPLGIRTAEVIRGGIIKINDQIISSLEETRCLEGGWLVIDASVDYSSLHSFLSWENRKRRFIDQLSETGKLEAYVGFSSGIVEFEPGVIHDEFKKEYRAAKIELEKFAASLMVPVYCPRIFTLIGPVTWAFGKIAWAQVAKQVIEEGVAKVGFPDEEKSWVAETTIEKQVRDFCSGNQAKSVDVFTPLDGIFTLRHVVEIISSQFGKPSELEPVVIQTWLDADYRSKIPHEINIKRLSQVLIAAIFTG